MGKIYFPVGADVCTVGVITFTVFHALNYNSSFSLLHNMQNQEKMDVFFLETLCDFFVFSNFAFSLYSFFFFGDGTAFFPFCLYFDNSSLFL